MYTLANNVTFNKSKSSTSKSIAVLPRSLTVLNLPKMSAATEWVDEDIDVVEVATMKKQLRESFTREFKL